MKLARIIVCGFAACSIGGGALAHESFASTPSDEAWMLFDPSVGWQGTWHDPEYSGDAARVYEVDEDRDGKADRLIILEESDTRA